MRGERDPGSTTTAGTYRGNATPSTPSTASTTVRQNPLSYQRMHSNDSDKDVNGNGANGNSSSNNTTPGIAPSGTSPGRTSD